MLILFLAAFLGVVPRVAFCECVDYNDYIHRLGGVDTPAQEQDIAFSGTIAYVITDDYFVNGTSSLQLIDFSNPASPTVLGSVVFPGNAYGLAASGTWAYVANGNWGLRVIDVSNPASPTIVGTLHTPGNNARAVAVSGTLAYVADGSAGLQVIDVSTPASPTIVGTVDTPGFPLDLALSGSIAYVADNVSGMQVIDVSNPTSPSILGSVDTPFNANKVAVYGTTALVVDDTLFIIDVSDPSSPAILQEPCCFGRVRDVAVSLSGVAYLASDWEGLVTYDITNTVSPYAGWLGNVDTRATAWAVAVSGGMAGVVARSTSGSESLSGIEFFDVSHPKSPPILSESIGNLSVAIDGTRIYTTGLYRIGTSNNFEPKLYVLDASNPQSPVALGFLVIACDAIAASGTTVYLASGVLQLIDASNPASMHVVGTATTGSATDVVVNGTMAYVANGGAGLSVVDVSNPSAPVIKGNVDTPGIAQGIDVSGSLVCVADRATGLQVIDISHPNPRILGSIDTPGNAIDVAMSGSLAFVTDDDAGAGFQVIDLSDPRSPIKLATLDLPGIANGIAVSGGTAYVANGEDDLQVIDVSNPSSPIIIGRGPDEWLNARKVAISGEIVCVTDAGPQGPRQLGILPVQCANSSPILPNPGTQTGSELQYFWVSVTATDANQDPLTMSLVGSLPPWATFVDAGSGAALIRGTPQAGQAGTYPISIQASDGRATTTVSFNIVIGTGGAQVGVDETVSPRFRLTASPNPFRAGLDLQFDLERDALVSVVILDLQGRNVRDLVTGEFPAGTHRTSWGGQDDRGQPLGAGLYFARLTTGDGRVQVQKLFKIR